MAQATATPSFADRVGWDTRIKPWLKTLAIAGIVFLVAYYIVAPRTAANQANFVPASFLELPTGAVTVLNADGTAALLPVRLAQTSSQRSAGFDGVGEDAMANQFLLYVPARATTNRASYAVDGFRVPVDFAAISAEGELVAMHAAPVGAARVSIAEPHRWILAAEAGTLDRFGIGVGSTLDPEAVRTF